jgi:hypothetical protein
MVYDYCESHTVRKEINANMFTLTHKLCAWALASVYGQAGYRLRGTEYKITHNQ